MKEKKSLGYIMGSVCAVVISICIMAIVIAITTKIVFWII